MKRILPLLALLLAAAAPPPAVTVVPASEAEIVETVTLTGSLAAREEVMVSPQVDGLAITEILAEEGDRVAQGQVLARLNRDTLLANQAQIGAQLARAEAAAAQARAQIAQMQATAVQTADALARARQLAQSGTASRETLEQREAASQVAIAQADAAKGALAAALADRAMAEAQLREITLKLDRTDIRAPVAGTISRRTARVGAVAGMSADTLFRLIADGALELEANVPETVLARLRPGQPAEIAITGHDRPRPGHVRLVSPEVGAQSRLGRVRIALDDSAGLPLGGFGRATVEIGRGRGVTVPLSAVLIRNGRAEVQVVADGTVSTRAVTLGLRDGTRALVRSGVAEGERVVAVSGTFVRNGDRVTPVAVK